MKKIYVTLIILSLIGLGVTTLKTELLVSSYKVGWDESKNELDLIIKEVESMSDHELIKESAIVMAQSDAKSGKYMARYIVYFYLSIFLSALMFGLFALLIWRASNKAIHRNS